MLIYRIVHKNFSKELYPSGMRGRWNSQGRKVIYCAESIALAFLENMIRRQGIGFNDDFKIMIIEVPVAVKFAIINTADLNEEWRDFRNYSLCQPLGDKWYDEGSTALLKVPSAVLPENYNYVINTTHPEYQKIKLIETTKLIPDPRIEEILKKYSGK